MQTDSVQKLKPEELPTPPPPQTSAAPAKEEAQPPVQTDSVQKLKPEELPAPPPPQNSAAPAKEEAQPLTDLYISIDSLKQLLEQQKFILLIDVRSEKAYRASHAAAAIHAQASKFIESYHQLMLGPRINGSHLTVVMCESEHCQMAEQVVQVLRDFGHKNVRVLHNGWEAYLSAGLEVETGKE